ncbi:MAG: hypothetical protein IH605_17745 [Burkholderiales bacterium]|nr:hypothetical protein [Burkholderiales bacterium]
MGVFFLAGTGIWFVLSVWAASRVAKWVKPGWSKPVLFLTVAPALFVAPVADELIGKYQYKRYCEEAAQVKIYATIPVGEELYTADGKWKLTDMSLDFRERNQIQALVDSIIRSDSGTAYSAFVPALIPIKYWDRKIYDAKPGRLLTEFRQYASRGGWLSRTVAEQALIVPAQCLPPLVAQSQLIQTLLPYKGNSGGTK